MERIIFRFETMSELPIKKVYVPPTLWAPRYVTNREQAKLFDLPWDLERQGLEKVLKKVMKQQGITQAEVAKRLRISESSITRYFQGNGFPRLKFLERIFTTFELPYRTIEDIEAIVPTLDEKAAQTYGLYAGNILDEYCTPVAVREEWIDATAEQKKTIVAQHQQSLEQRSLFTLGRKYVETVDTDYNKQTMIRVLDLLVETEFLSATQRTEEKMYRESVQRVYTNFLRQKKREDVIIQNAADVIARYCTSPQQRDEWTKMAKEKRYNVVGEHYNSLLERSIEALAREYGVYGKNIEDMLTYGVKEGIMSLEERQEEESYRQSVYGLAKVVQRKGVHGLGEIEQCVNGFLGAMAGSSKGGKKSYALGRGVHGMSVEDLRISGREGGRIAKREKEGIFAEDATVTAAALAGVRAREQTPYSGDERALIVALTTDPTYHLYGRYNPPRPDWQRIADAVSEQSGVMRNKMSVRKQYEKLMKRK